MNLTFSENKYNKYQKYLLHALTLTTTLYSYILFYINIDFYIGLCVYVQAYF